MPGEATENLSAVSTMLADPAAAPADPAAATPAATTQAPAADPAAPPAADPANPAATEAPAAVTMPGKDATPEQWSAFYAALRPETAEAYELPVPDGDDGAFAKEASGWMHEAGLSKDQAGKLAGKWNDMVAAQAQAAQAEEAAAAQAQHVKNTAEQGELQQEWGQQFDANMHHAKIAVQQFLPKEGAAGIIGAIESKVGYKATIQFLHNIGVKLGEHDAAGLGANTAGAAKKTTEEVFYGVKS